MGSLLLNMAKELSVALDDRLADYEQILAVSGVHEAVLDAFAACVRMEHRHAWLATPHVLEDDVRGSSRQVMIRKRLLALLALEHPRCSLSVEKRDGP